MATLTAVNPKWLRSATRPTMSVENWLVDGDATFEMGELCRIASDGLVYEGITGANSGVGDDAVHLYALEPVGSAIGNDTTRKRFARIHADDEFEMHELDGTVSEATKGQVYDMDVTSNVCTVNVDSSSHAIFEVVNPTWREEPILNDSADVKARLVVKVLETALNATKTN